MHLRVGYMPLVSIDNRQPFSFRGSCNILPLSDSFIACQTRPPRQYMHMHHPVFSHPPDLLLVHVFVETLIQVLPPLKQQRIADKLEPRCKFQGGVVEHRLETIGGNVSSVFDFVRVWLCINVGLDEENVVNCVGGGTLADQAKTGLGRHSLSCSPHFPSLGAL